ncbi:MAG TPA: GNAT family N-acetyltransferase [Gillisia sp.]|nr:GNAT family N-acetyltransferase [Gillisia sp.]
MSATFVVKKISASATYPLRSQVLRPGRPVSECYFHGDDEEDSFHLGVFKNETIIGVASFIKNSSPFFDPEFQYQLRGMAVVPEFKGMGKGALLLKEGESMISEKNPDPFLWFNARMSAVEFYKKHGYQTFGNKFDVPGVCEHILMFRHLIS